MNETSTLAAWHAHASSLLHRGRPFLGLSPFLLGAVSALVTFLLFLTQTFLRGRYPFGSKTFLIGDEYSQYLPMAAEYRRILLGTTELSSYNWTWSVAGGVPMNGNIATYDGGLLFPVVLLFTPETHIELALFIITGLSYAIAAWAMTFLLRTLFQNEPWIDLVISASYALSAWALQDAGYVPMWLSGFYMLPLVALAAHYTYKRERFLFGVLIVALMWWSNYYTAYMASIGAALFLVYYLVEQRASVATFVRAIGTFALQGLLGVALTAPMWLPTWKQVSAGIEQPGSTADWVGFSTFFAHFLPWTQALSRAPSFALSTFVLLLAFYSVTSSDLPKRLRVINFSTLLILFFSLAFPQTLTAWNVFDSPNGNPWRPVFTVVFFLSLLAGSTGSRLTFSRLYQYVLPLVFVAVLSAITLTTEVELQVQPVFLILSVFAAAVLCLHIGFQPKRVRFYTPTAVVTICVVLADLLLSNVWMLDSRDAELFEEYPLFTATAEAELAAASTMRSEWKEHHHRVVILSNSDIDPSLSNKGLLLSLPSTAYYSSLIPASSLVLANTLGSTTNVAPRTQSATLDSVANAMMGNALTFNADSAQSPLKALPFAHVIDDAVELSDVPETSLPGFSSPKSNIFHSRNVVFGQDIYQTPADITFAPSDIAYTRDISTTVNVSLTCPTPASLSFDARGLSSSLRSNGKEEIFSNEVLMLHNSVDEGKTHYTLSFPGNLAFEKDGLLPEDRFSCFNREKYEQSISQAAAAQTHTTRFGDVDLRFHEPTSGIVLLKMPAVKGFSCHAAGKSLPVRSLFGLTAIQVQDVTNVSCAYRPPAIRTAFAICIAAFLLTMTLTIIGKRRHLTGSGKLSSTAHTVAKTHPLHTVK